MKQISPREPGLPHKQHAQFFKEVDTSVVFSTALLAGIPSGAQKTRESTTQNTPHHYQHGSLQKALAVVASFPTG